MESMTISISAIWTALFWGLAVAVLSYVVLFFVLFICRQFKPEMKFHKVVWKIPIILAVLWFLGMALMTGHDIRPQAEPTWQYQKPTEIEDTQEDVEARSEALEQKQREKATKLQEEKEQELRGKSKQLIDQLMGDEEKLRVQESTPPPTETKKTD